MSSLTIRRVMTDVDLCIDIVPEGEENYRRALDVISAYPDYAKTQFRIVVEKLTSRLAIRFHLDVGQDPLYEVINALHASQVIDGGLRSALHTIRKAGNAVVHSVRDEPNPQSAAARGTEVACAGDLQSALEARKILVGVFESVFLLLNIGTLIVA